MFTKISTTSYCIKSSRRQCLLPQTKRCQSDIYKVQPSYPYQGTFLPQRRRNCRLVYIMEARNMNANMWNKNVNHRDNGAISIGSIIRFPCHMYIETYMRYNVPLIVSHHHDILMEYSSFFTVSPWTPKSKQIFLLVVSIMALRYPLILQQVKNLLSKPLQSSKNLWLDWY